MSERPHSGVRSHDDTSFKIGELQASDYFGRGFTYGKSEMDLLTVNSLIGLHPMSSILRDRTDLQFGEYLSIFQINLMCYKGVETCLPQPRIFVLFCSKGYLLLRSSEDMERLLDINRGGFGTWNSRSFMSRFIGSTTRHNVDLARFSSFLAVYFLGKVSQHCQS